MTKSNPDRKSLSPAAFALFVEVGRNILSMKFKTIASREYVKKIFRLGATRAFTPIQDQVDDVDLTEEMQEALPEMYQEEVE